MTSLFSTLYILWEDSYLIVSLMLQEPSEEAFDVDSVPKEVKSQPLAEKKAKGKKPTGLGAPPPAPVSGFDAYERLLSSIPEFATFGKLFKVCIQIFCTRFSFEFTLIHTSLLVKHVVILSLPHLWN